MMDNPLSMFKQLREAVTDFHEKVSGKRAWIGIVNATEDFLQQAEDYQYLVELSNTEYNIVTN
jgi:hypothetical protein